LKKNCDVLNYTCNIEAGLAPLFTRTYETLLWSRVGTAFFYLCKWSSFKGHSHYTFLSIDFHLYACEFVWPAAIYNI